MGRTPDDVGWSDPYRHLEQEVREDGGSNGRSNGHGFGFTAAVFDAITDIDRLPEWNKTIRRVVERPDAPTEGAEWSWQ